MSLWNTIVAVLRVAFCTLNNLYAIPVYLLYHAVFLPLKWIQPKMFWYLEGLLYEKLLSMVASWAQISGHTLAMTGDDISSIVDDECVLMCNHQSSGDIPVLMYAMRGIQPSLRHCMWIMDWILQFLNFGWIAKGHKDFFMLQGSDIRKFSFLFKGTEQELKQNDMKRFKGHLSDVYCGLDRKWIVIFPEGGFLSKRLAGSQRFSKRNNLPVLTHVSIPRTGAFQAIVDVLGIRKVKGECSGDAPNGNVKSYRDIDDKKLKWIIDATIGYPNNHPMGMGSWVAGRSEKISIHYRVYNASDILQPTVGDRDIISENWFYDRFAEKEKLLENFYETGAFPEGKMGQKLVDCNTAPTVFGNLFCICILVAVLSIFI